MELTGSMKCVKYTVMFFNLLFLLCGAALVIVGILVEVRFHEYGDQLGKTWQAAPIAVIVVGSVILLVSFLGCCGSLKESLCMLYLYSALLVIIIVAEVAAAVAAVVLKGKVRASFSETIDEAVKNYNSEEFGKMVDLWQKNFKCCGANSSVDYVTTKVPTSCYADSKDLTTIYKTGCTSAFVSFVEKNVILIAVVASLVAFLQLLGVIASCCLVSHIKNYEPV